MPIEFVNFGLICS